jgi:FAD/FMN-containing dehydrogenase
MQVACYDNKGAVMGFAISRRGQSAQALQASRITDELTALLGEAAVVRTPVGRMLFRGDGGVVVEDPPAAVVMPGDEQALVKAMRFCHQHGLDVVPRGGATSVRGGAIGSSESVVIATSRLSRVGEVHRRDRLVEAEAGAMLTAIERAAAGERLRLGVGPRVGSPATLGGGIAKAVCGPAAGIRGTVAARVEALRLILADGEAVELRDGTAGLGAYDLAGLIAGSEGVLGIISKATIRLEPQPDAFRLIVARFATVDAAVAAAMALDSRSWPVRALDVAAGRLFDGTTVFADGPGGGADGSGDALVLVEVEGYVDEAALAAADLLEQLWQQGTSGCEEISDDTRRRLVWEAFDGAPARLSRGHVAGMSDFTVPPTALSDAVRAVDEIAQRHGLEAPTCVRAGAGVVQSVFLAPGDAADGASRVQAALNEAVAMATESGGLAAGSFGAGVLKTASPGYGGLSAADIAMQLAVKAVFDGDGVLNRGKVVA